MFENQKKYYVLGGKRWYHGCGGGRSGATDEEDPRMNDRTSDMSLDICCSPMKISCCPLHRDCTSLCIPYKCCFTSLGVSFDFDSVSCEGSVSCSPKHQHPARMYVLSCFSTIPMEIKVSILSGAVPPITCMPRVCSINPMSRNIRAMQGPVKIALRYVMSFM